mmetsp:Transcript_37053/g.47883  ORF Transcript_37053/g.47883 Transcript_37053/m.47883 type:complete len:195 (+) Transcript_37053:231-815(+)
MHHDWKKLAMNQMNNTPDIDDSRNQNLTNSRTISTSPTFKHRNDGIIAQLSKDIDEITVQMTKGRKHVQQLMAEQRFQNSMNIENQFGMNILLAQSNIGVLNTGIVNTQILQVKIGQQVQKNKDLRTSRGEKVKELEIMVKDRSKDILEQNRLSQSSTHLDIDEGSDRIDDEMCSPLAPNVTMGMKNHKMNSLI